MSVELPDRVGPYRVSPPDGRLLVFVLLAVVVQVGALAIVAVDPFGSASTAAAATPAETASDPLTAVQWAVVLIAQSLLFVGVVLALQRAPGWLRRGLAFGLTFAVLLVVGSVLRGDAVAIAAAYAVSSMVFLHAVDHFDVLWIPHAIVALSVAAVAAVSLGHLMTPPVLALFVLGVVVWDRVAVVESSIMGRLAGAAIRWRLPLVVLVPTRVRTSFDTMESAMSDEGESDALLLGVGLGDLVVPAGVTIAVVVSGGSPAVVGAVVFGTITGIVAMESLSVDGLRPAMPWLGSGAVGGWVVATVLVGVVG